MAISGRLVATASRISPPRAWPRCRRSARTSVLSDRKIPAIQMVAALATKTRSSAQNGRCGSRFMCALVAGRYKLLLYGKSKRGIGVPPVEDPAWARRLPRSASEDDDAPPGGCRAGQCRGRGLDGVV